MASNLGEDGRLTNSQISQLSRGISHRNMTSIAEEYLDIDPPEVQSLEDTHRADDEAFKRAVIRKWAYKPENSGSDQIKKLASLLYQAASEGSYIDARKVRQILGVSEEENAAPEGQTTVTESDILTLAEEVRPDVEKSTRIQLFPWVRGYVVDIDKLYSVPYMETIENELTGPKGVQLRDYKELFNGAGVSERKGRGMRILVKGNPGIGKTIFAKKVVWDWSQRFLDEFYVVFFVTMKFVKPGDTIENILIDQTPNLKGLGVEPKRLANFLNTFGNKILIILDGFDERFSESDVNDDVMELLNGNKFLRCHVLVTSRPHNIAEIEELFHPVLQLQGFTEENATQFASFALKDQTLVRGVLEVRQCSQDGKYSPILLFFICVLANNKEIDLKYKNVTAGEIYTRLVRCLYRKYVVGKGKRFKHSEFVDYLRTVGSLSFEMLQNFRARYKQDADLKDVRSDIFKTGLLAGYEDYRLSADETADIVIDFPHQTIQEFLAAFFCLDAQNSEADIQAIFKKYPLIPHFCFWFLSKKSSEDYNLRFEGTEDIERVIKSIPATEIESFKENMGLKFVD